MTQSAHIAAISAGVRIEPSESAKMYWFSFHSSDDAASIAIQTCSPGT
ncbi:MAG: hypothetical protein R2748_10400 [Bryobacterales bacterium]